MRTQMKLVALCLVGTVVGCSDGDALALPDCEARWPGPLPPVVHRVQEAYGELDHPAGFLEVQSDRSGCDGFLDDIGFADAAAHYRTELSAAGWEITSNTDTTLGAKRGGLRFVLTPNAHHSDHPHIAILTSWPPPRSTRDHGR